MNNIEIIIENTNERRMVAQDTSLAEVAQAYYTDLGRMPLENPILGALVNNKVENLQYHLYKPKTIRFFDVKHTQGWRMYQSSLIFMLYKAVRNLYPSAKLAVKHSLNGGFYCTIDEAPETGTAEPNVYLHGFSGRHHPQDEL